MKYFPSFISAAPHTLFRLIFLYALAIGCLGTFAVKGAAQTPAVRPIARLITSSRDVTPAPSSLTSAINVTSAIAATGLEQQAFDLINAERHANGKDSLVWDAELCRMARSHSENMARFDFFDHAGPGGMDLAARARAHGVRGWDILSENITYNKGYTDPAAFAVERWMLSPKHRSNLLHSRFTHSGIGVARAADGRVFFTQVFIAR